MGRLRSGGRDYEVPPGVRAQAGGVGARGGAGDAVTRTAVVVLACWVGGVAACAYYNGMWNAEHLASQARKLERQDRVAEAQTYWAQAAVKAESVVARHPTSRWADAALVLEGEALARGGACAQAAAPPARAGGGGRAPAPRGA